jgi:hypothetical protein
VDLSRKHDSLIAAHNRAGDLNHSRSAVLRAAVEASEFKAAVYNPSFVLIEYFGYLRRDTDRNGFQFWLNVLNDGDQTNYRRMVCSFITSTEYQRRFGNAATHSNAECGP